MDGNHGCLIGLAGRPSHSSDPVLNGNRGRFYSAQNLLDELYSSLADRSTPKLLQRLASYDLLLIDELGYLTLQAEQVNAFFLNVTDLGGALPVEKIR